MRETFLLCGDAFEVLPGDMNHYDKEIEKYISFSLGSARCPING